MYFLNDAKTKYVTFFLDVYLMLQLKIACTSSAVVLNAIAWLILSSSKNGMLSNTVYELGDCYHTLDRH